MQLNLKVLIVNGIAPPIMNTENRKTVTHGKETVTYRVTFFWANLHTKYKNAKFLDEFKSKIKGWKCDFCQCRLCKKYMQNLGFI